MSDLEMPEVDWYYLKQGRQYGPVAERSIHAWLEAGFLKEDDLVWRAGLEDWTAVAELSEFGGSTVTAAPEQEERSGPSLSDEESPPAGSTATSAFGGVEARPVVVPLAWPPTRTKVVFATFGMRFLAFLIDYVFVNFLVIFVSIPHLLKMEQPPHIGMNDPVLTGTTFAVWIVYFTMLESSKWQVLWANGSCGFA